MTVLPGDLINHQHNDCRDIAGTHARFGSVFSITRPDRFVNTSNNRLLEIKVIPVNFMASTQVKSGALVMLLDLDPSGPYFMDGASLRVTGKLQNYSVETAIATIADGGVALNIDTQHLRDLRFRLGSIYQFIGELHIETNNKAILQARVGRNVDGMDLNLYHQSLQLVRQFEAGLMKFPMS